MKKTDLEKRFDPLFERISKADISLNRPGFYKKLRQELKRERRKMVREIKDWLDVQAVSDWLTKSGTPRIVHDLKSYLDNYLKEREK